MAVDLHPVPGESMGLGERLGGPDRGRLGEHEVAVD
jgi:hypothetical protein